MKENTHNNCFPSETVAIHKLFELDHTLKNIVSAPRVNPHKNQKGVIISFPWYNSKTAAKSQFFFSSSFCPSFALWRLHDIVVAAKGIRHHRCVGQVDPDAIDNEAILILPCRQLDACLKCPVRSTAKQKKEQGKKLLGCHISREQIQNHQLPIAFIPNTTLLY